MADSSESKIRNQDFIRKWTAAHNSLSAFLLSFMGNTEDVDDVLQEVAIVALSNYEKYDTSKPFIAWAIGIAKNVALNHMRKTKRAGDTVQVELLDHLAAATQRIESENPILFEALESCVQKVEGRAKQVLTMKYVDGLKIKLIAQKMELSPNTVSVSLYRIRAALHECIEKFISRKGMS